MRKIEFRGKRLDNGEWVRGDLLHTYELNSETKEVKLNGHYIISQEGDDIEDCFISRSIEVAPDSVGQFTGLRDKNGKEIYEGDIIDFTNVDYPDCEIIFNNASFVCNEIGEDNIVCELRLGLVNEVIGNIHDNPELLKGGEK